MDYTGHKYRRDFTGLRVGQDRKKDGTYVIGIWMGHGGRAWQGLDVTGVWKGHYGKIWENGCDRNRDGT